MINTKVTVDGNQFDDYRLMTVSKSVSDNYTTSWYEISFDSPYGRHKTDFTVGDEVKIYADKDNSPTTNILTGIVDTVNFQGEGLNEVCTLRGRDYSALLMDNTVEPVVYTNTEVGSIVRNIVTNTFTDIGSTFIETTNTVLKRIAFNQLSAFESIKQLGDLSGYTFYVDNDKELHFEQLGGSPSNVLLNSGNLISMTFDSTREGMANKIWVYGDRSLVAAPREVFAVGATPGSVYTLQNRPHNTQVQTSNVTPGSNLKGGIFDMVTANSASGTDYLVSFFDRQIIFMSGTQLGYSTIPNSNGSVVVNYEREVPIVKYGENRNSINLYKPKTKVINDKSIKDPNTAVSILNRELSLVDPLNNIQVQLKGWYTFQPGQTVNIVVDDFNLVQEGTTITEKRYQFTPSTVASEDVISLTLDKRVIDITDQIRELNRRIEALESQDRQDSDVFTRLEYATGSVLIVGSYWTISQRWNGSEFRVWSSSNVPPLGSNFTPVLGLLASGNIAHSSWVGSVSYLASGVFGYGPFVRVSGGYT